MQCTSSLLRLAALSALIAAPLSLRAQSDADSDWNHFGLNFRSGFNIRAKFAEPASVEFPAPARDRLSIINITTAMSTWTAAATRAG